MYREIIKTIESLKDHNISDDRKLILQPLVSFIQSRILQKKSIRLNFICTHNSRRSHLSQIWAQTIADYVRLKDVYAYSGGTEATAVYPMVLETLSNSGFRIDALSTSDNPIYSIKFDDNEPAILGFSKKYDHSYNPNSDFAAILTCSQADEGCPFIAGAAQRIPITFEDPKAFDGTSQQKEKYQERSLQIAAELFYVFTSI